MLENTILPKDPGFVRVSTPPRVISLSEHHFPSASDEPDEEEREQDQSTFGPKSMDFIDDRKHVGYKNNNRKVVSQISQDLSFNHR